MKRKLFVVVGAVLVAATLTLLMTHHAAAPTAVSPTPSPPDSNGSPLPHGNGTVAGAVTVGPTTPTCRSGESCSGPGAGLAVEAFYPNEQPAGATKTDASGHYSLSLPAGKYNIAAKNGYITKSASVTVAPGQTVNQDFSLDTGIR